MFDTLVKLYGNWQLRNKANKVRKDTVNQLNGLSDKTLRDIGVNRSDINYLSMQHYNEILNAEKRLDRIKAQAMFPNINLRGWV